jgi:hypothetical protein
MMPAHNMALRQYNCGQPSMGEWAGSDTMMPTHDLRWLRRPSHLSGHEKDFFQHNQERQYPETYKCFQRTPREQQQNPHTCIKFQKEES